LFYHRLLELTVRRLTDEGYDWIGGDEQQMLRTSRKVLAELGSDLAAETGQERVHYVLERAELLLEHQVRRLIIAARGMLDEQGIERCPLSMEAGFGHVPGAVMPAVRIETDSGVLQLSGYIDRVDLIGADKLVAVDYKLGRRDFNWGLFSDGVQIQLMVYLLALQQHGLPAARELPVGKKEAVPAWAELQPVEPYTANDGRLTLDSRSAPSKKEGIGRLPLLLDATREILAGLGLRLLAGEISPRPLWEAGSNGFNACSSCPYRPLCRFDPVAGERYRESSSLKLDALLDAAKSAGGTGHE
jgi:ATP-dependent helicase/DNAse subunit B